MKLMKYLCKLFGYSINVYSIEELEEIYQMPINRRKIYVSLDIAILLKEHNFTNETIAYYHKNELLINICDNLIYPKNFNKIKDVYSAPLIKDVLKDFDIVYDISKSSRYYATIIKEKLLL